MEWHTGPLGEVGGGVCSAMQNLHGGEGNCVGLGWVGGGGGILNCQEESLLGTLKTLRISLT